MLDNPTSTDESARPSLLEAMDEKSQGFWKAAIAKAGGKTTDLLMEICEDMHTAIASLMAGAKDAPTTRRVPSLEYITLFLEVIDLAREAHASAGHDLQGVTRDEFRLWVNAVKERPEVYLHLLIPFVSTPPKIGGRPDLKKR